jgi:hypothetical protein
MFSQRHFNTASKPTLHSCALMPLRSISDIRLKEICSAFCVGKTIGWCNSLRTSLICTNASYGVCASVHSFLRINAGFWGLKILFTGSLPFPSLFRTSRTRKSAPSSTRQSRVERRNASKAEISSKPMRSLQKVRRTLSNPTRRPGAIIVRPNQVHYISCWRRRQIICARASGMEAHFRSRYRRLLSGDSP